MKQIIWFKHIFIVLLFSQHALVSVAEVVLPVEDLEECLYSQELPAGVAMPSLADCLDTSSIPPANGYSDDFLRIDMNSYDYNNSIIGLENGDLIYFLPEEDANHLLWDSLFIASVLATKQTLREDLQGHYLAGALSGRAAAALCEELNFNPNGMNPDQMKFLCSFGAATLVGILKEVYDGASGTGQAEFSDAVATSLGGVVIGLRFVIKRR